ncbi:MAG TPA: S24 family peptidase [Gammaproteobacteria bacterium]|nr:S24 family peptidase [Gammaproteobacteria bacterium]
MNERGKTTILGDLLRRERGRVSITDMAARIGVNKNTLGAYERGQRLPDIEFLARFAQVTGGRFFDLFQARLASSASAAVREIAGEGPGSSPLENPAARSDFLLPPFAPDLTLDSVQKADSASPVGFRQWWLRRHGIEDDRLMAAQITTDSMGPTVVPGDLVLLDLTRNRPAEAVYAIRAPEGLLLRRLQRLPGQRLRLITDNPSYHDSEISVADIGGAASDFELFGQVVWMSRFGPR